MGASIGGFAGGLASGLDRGMRLRDNMDKRKEKKTLKAQDDEIAKAFATKFDSYDAPAPTAQGNAMQVQPAQDNFGLNQFAKTNFVDPAKEDETQVTQNFKNGGMVVKKHADGGLITQEPPMAADQSSLVGQVQQNTPALSAAPESLQPKQVDKGLRLSQSYNAARDKAIELGRMDKAKEFQDMGFQIRDRMTKEGLPAAQRQFQMTGDIGGFVNLYNNAVEDDANIDGFEKTANGYMLKINEGGNITQREVANEELEGMIMQFSDPAARYAMEREALAKRNGEIFKTDEEIRKARALEKDKAALETKVLAPGGMLVDNTGKELVNNPKPPPRERGETDAEFYMRDPIEYAKYKAAGRADGTGGSGSSGGGKGKGEKDFNKEMLPVLKEVSDSILSFPGMMELDENTQEKRPTAQGNNAVIYGQGVIKHNPNLTPAVAAKIAAQAASDPKSTTFKNFEDDQGNTYKQAVVLYNGEAYAYAGEPKLISKGNAKPADKPAAKTTAAMQPRVEEKAAPQENEPDERQAKIKEARQLEKTGMKARTEKLTPENEKFYQNQGLSYLEKEYKRLIVQKGKYAQPEKAEYLDKLIKAKRAVDISKVRAETGQS